MYLEYSCFNYQCKIDIPELSALKLLQQQFKLMTHFKIHKAEVVHNYAATCVVSKTTFFCESHC